MVLNSMVKLLKNEAPIGVLIIGIFEIISALVLLMTLDVNQIPPFNIRFGVPFVPELLVRICVAIFTIVMCYGYLRLKKWGYWCMTIETGIFCIVSLVQIINYGGQPFVNNCILAAIIFVYTVYKRSIFIEV